MSASLPLIEPESAFVDVGSEKMHVSIAGGPPEVFGTVTSELHRLRDWLSERQVRLVAMEATGVYWLAALQYSGGGRVHGENGQWQANPELARLQN